MASILNADNGVVSGSAGLKSSADSSGVLELQTNGTTGLSISTGQVVTVANGMSIQGLTVGRGAGSLDNNAAFGNLALATNSTGAYNTAVGSYEGDAGRAALRYNTTGNYNAAFGNGALGANTTASSNSAFGFQSSWSNTTGASNVSVGFQSLRFNTTASNSTAVGYQAGYTSTGQRNAFFGSEAGYSNTTGESNTYIGRQAGYSMTTGVNNTIIGRYNGNQNSLDIRTLSNYIVLSDGDGNPRFYSDNTGVLYDQNGKLRAVPQSGSSKTSSYTLATTDVGEYILLGASGAIVIPDVTFAAGDIVTIFNNTASTATITCSITTAYIAGTFTDKATMTLAAAGVATVLFITSTLCVVSGNVT